MNQRSTRPVTQAAVLLLLLGMSVLAAGCQSGEMGKRSGLEYVLVTIVSNTPDTAPAPRTVLIDGVDYGTTAELIECEGGRVTVTLKGTKDYTPLKHDLDVSGTSAATPKKIEFRVK